MYTSSARSWLGLWQIHEQLLLCCAGRNITFRTGSAVDDCALRLADIDLDYHNPSDFGDAADFVRRTIKQRVTQAAVRPKAGQTVQVALHYLLTSTISLHSRVHSEVARHVTFIDALYALAAKAAARLKAETGMPGFNGVHLRIEDDFSHVKDAGAGCKHSTSSQIGCAPNRLWCLAQTATGCCHSTQKRLVEPGSTLRYRCILLAGSLKRSPSLHSSGDTALRQATCTRSSC